MKGAIIFNTITKIIVLTAMTVALVKGNYEYATVEALFYIGLTIEGLNYNKQ